MTFDIYLPEVNAEELPRLVLSNGQRCDLPLDLVMRIAHWHLKRCRYADVEQYIADIESGEEDPPEGVTPEMIRENIMDVVDEYDNRMSNDASWYDVLRDSVRWVF